MTNIVDIIISKFGKDFREAGNNRSEMTYNCPFCKSKRGKADNDRKLYVNKYTGYFFVLSVIPRGE